MRALICDICGRYFNPIEDSKIYARAGLKVINRCAFLESHEGGHEVVKAVDVCYCCITKMFDAVNFSIPISEEKKND